MLSVLELWITTFKQLLKIISLLYITEHDEEHGASMEQSQLHL